MQICSSILWPEQQIWDLSSFFDFPGEAGVNEVQRKVISFFLHSVCFDFPKLPGCQISTFYPQGGICLIGQALCCHISSVLCWASGLHFESSISCLLFLKIGVGESTLFAALCAVRPLAEGICWFL